MSKLTLYPLLNAASNGDNFKVMQTFTFTVKRSELKSKLTTAGSQKIPPVLLNIFIKWNLKSFASCHGSFV